MSKFTELSQHYFTQVKVGEVDNLLFRVLSKVINVCCMAEFYIC